MAKCIAQKALSNTQKQKQFFCKCSFFAPILVAPSISLVFFRGTNYFSAKRQSVPVEEPKISSTRTKSFL